jgi:hypothetical protein
MIRAGSTPRTKKKAEQWPTARAVAQALGCSRQHVYKLEKNGKLKARDVQRGGVTLRRFDPEQVRRFSEGALELALRPPAPGRPAAPMAGMLTRMQVARALGRSIATVRRIEGELLHPRLVGGIWRFKRREVDELAAEIRSGRRRLIGSFPIAITPPRRELPPNVIALCHSCARRAAAALKGAAPTPPRRFG